jgi:insulin-like growth factor 2 mRNA-binding protein 1
MDLQAMAPQSVMFPGLHPAAMMSTVGLGVGQAAYRPNPAGPPAGARPVPPQVPTETTYLFIPNTAVGAIIGEAGKREDNFYRISKSGSRCLSHLN